VGAHWRRRGAVGRQCGVPHAAGLWNAPAILLLMVDDHVLWQVGFLALSHGLWATYATRISAG